MSIAAGGGAFACALSRLSSALRSGHACFAQSAEHARFCAPPRSRFTVGWPHKCSRDPMTATLGS